MQQFVVPQFIDVEDKVIGPITVRQFIILLVGAGLIFVSYKLSDFALFLLEGIFLLIITFVFAFIKVNGRPIHYLLVNVLQTARNPKIQVWIKSNPPQKTKGKGKKEKVSLPVEIPRHNTVRASRLAELSLIVDTGGIYQGEATVAQLGEELS